MRVLFDYGDEENEHWMSVDAHDRQRVQEFTYDDAGRLHKVIWPEREVTYTLDDAGNRSSLDSA